MRVSAALFAFLLCGLAPGVAFAQAGSEAPKPTEPAPAAADPTQSARRHFRNGVKLYQDTNFSGALAEFEAAYELKPGHSSLQNVALCQKALFRYGEAADTLRLLLERHADELSADEQKAMRQAIDELEGLVGSLVIKVQPAHARVALDGQVVGPEQQGKRLRTNVGEHTVVAEAPGYARLARTLRVASGQHDQSVELNLEPMMGFLDITSEDPQAVIAVDGKALARQRWSGPVTPGEDHLIQVYRPGFESFEQVVQVPVGKTASVRAVLGAPLDEEAEDEEADPSSGLPSPPGGKATLGWYGMAALSLLGAGTTPLELDVTNAGASTSAGAIGLRGGYRFWKPIAGELMLDFGNLQVTDACDPKPSAARSCDSDDPIVRDYRISWVRVGPNLRFLSGGDRVRFVAGAGVGAVFHRLELDPYVEAGQTLLPGQDAFGVDPYFALEVGIGFNLGHWLMEAVALASIDGTNNLKSDLLEGSASSRNTLPIVGLSLKFGYSQWKSR